jgi:serine/threonine-protein kinase HipA
MRKAKIFLHGVEAGILIEIIINSTYRFEYLPEYTGTPVSIVMPIEKNVFEFNGFPPFLDGLLPEGFQLEGLIQFKEVEKNDLFKQLMCVGSELVGAITVKEIL